MMMNIQMVVNLLLAISVIVLAAGTPRWVPIAFAVVSIFLVLIPGFIR